MNQCVDLLIYLKDYFIKNLNIIINPISSTYLGKIRYHLLECYEFFDVNLFGNGCLLMVDKERRNIDPEMVKKHIIILNSILEIYHTIYVQSTISSCNRKWLINMNIPFIIPGNQMYLPHFSQDLILNFRKIDRKKKKTQ